MYATEFVFDGISSKEYDLIICSFDGNNNGAVTAGSNIEFTTFKAPNSNRWRKTSATYKEPLSFQFQCCKYNENETKHEPISERELAFFMRWLTRKDYKIMQFNQEEFENIFFNCQISVEKYMIAEQCRGLVLTIICDAPHGWSELKSMTIESDGTKNMTIYDDSDEIGFIYPTVEIKSKADNDIIIENSMTNSLTQIYNCKANETILMKDELITSSECVGNYETQGYSGNHPSLFQDFNWGWFSIGNSFQERENNITITGKCTISLSWRVPRKATL